MFDQKWMVVQRRELHVEVAVIERVQIEETTL